MVRDYHEVRFGQYSTLFEYLMTHREEDSIILTFDEIERILRRELPQRARTHGIGWWTTNPTAVQARSWLAASRHPYPTTDGRMEFVKANSISRNGSVKHLRTTHMSVNYARDRLNGSVPVETLIREINDGWWEAHIVYVIRYDEAGVTKVGLTNLASSRIRALTSIGGLLLDSIQVPNRWVATVLEGECLVHVDAFRTEPPLWIAQVAGATEFWRDGVELPPLHEMFDATCATDAASAWVSTIPRLNARGDTAGEGI